MRPYANVRHKKPDEPPPYRRELFEITDDIQKLTNIHELDIEEIEWLLKLGGRLAGVYRTAEPARKRAIVKLVALNLTLKDGNAYLSLHPAFVVFQHMGSHPKWWAVVRDLRTALKENPFSLDVLKQLLGEAAQANRRISGQETRCTDEHK